MKEPKLSDAKPEPVLSVAAPVYNEEQTIEAVVRRWAEVTQMLGVQAEFVLANDGSTDRTVEILERLSAEIPSIRIVAGEVNRGYGHALSKAIAACRGRFVATIDSDGQFDLADVEDFLRKLQDESCDGVVGYRVRKRDTAARVVADRCLNLLTRVMFGTRLRDTNCALKVIRRERLQALTFEATGFAFPTEVVLKLEATGARLAEAPVRHLERAGGHSKLKILPTGWRMLRFLFYLRRRLKLWRARIVQNP